MSNAFQSAGVQAMATCGATATCNTAPAATPRQRSHGQAITRQHAGLSFWTVTESVRGRTLCSRAFDVAAEEFDAGYVTGLRVFIEFMHALRAAEPRFHAGTVIEAAHEAAQEGADGLPSRRGAAAAFLIRLSSAVVVAAQHFEFEAAALGEIAAVEGLRAFHQKQREGRKTAFVQRMKAARQAKAVATRQGVK